MILCEVVRVVVIVVLDRPVCLRTVTTNCSMVAARLHCCSWPVA